MKYVLTIAAHADTPQMAEELARTALQSSTSIWGQPATTTVGNRHGSASAKWQRLTCTDDGDDSTEVVDL